MSKFNYFVLAAAVAACSSNSDGKVAGGQSGTDASGSYSCNLSNPVIESVPLDRQPTGLFCSPEQAFAQVEGERSAYACSKLGISFIVNIERGGAARRLTGTDVNDTSQEQQSVTPCYAMDVDASVHISASDQSLTFAASTLFVEHLCSKIAIDGQPSNVHFTLEETGTVLDVINDDGEDDVCVWSEAASGSGG